MMAKYHSQTSRRAKRAEIYLHNYGKTQWRIYWGAQPPRNFRETYIFMSFWYWNTNNFLLASLAALESSIFCSFSRILLNLKVTILIKNTFLWVFGVKKTENFRLASLAVGFCHTMNRIFLGRKSSPPGNWVLDPPLVKPSWKDTVQQYYVSFCLKSDENWGYLCTVYFASWNSYLSN